MYNCFYKKTFFKDLIRIPKDYQQRIANLVLEKIPESNDIFSDFDIIKMKGYSDYYRIRAGNYRIGCRIPTPGTIIFFRVVSREEIYKVFP
jgi:mRNA interferase RelE/StbE